MTVTLVAPTADETRAYAVRLAALLRAGDLLILSGDLGAGKTTFTQGGLELDDLDLDTALEEAVTVVEWGTGVAEGLAEDRLEVELLRAHGDTDDESRTIRLTALGPRWVGVDLPDA